MKLNQFRRGQVFRLEGELWQIIQMDLNTPGNWRSMFQVKMKNVLKGSVITKRISPTEELEDVFLETRDMEYLYREGENYVFMDSENFDQTTLTPENPRAAQIAVSGLDAIAIWTFRPVSSARREIAAATSCGKPKSPSRPDASIVAVSGAVASTSGENSKARAVRSPAP